MVVVDEEEFRRLPAEIAVARAGQALVLGDVAGAVKYARRVRDLVPEGDQLGRGSAAALLGLAYWASGDLEAAHRTFSIGMAHLQKAGYISDTVGGSVALADILIAQGRLREAMRTYERGLQLAVGQPVQGAPVLRGAADMYVGMSALVREHNDLEAATQHLLKSKELGEYNGFPQNGYRWRVAMARIREAQGDIDGALDLLQEAEGLYVSDFFPNVRPVAALKTRVWVAQGRLDEALDWARERGLSVEDDLSYLREFEHITLARVLLAQYKSDRGGRSLLEATGLLERLLQAAEEGGRTGSVMDILVLQARALQMQGDTPAALMPLQRALTLAEPEGYIRLFVDERMPMAALLQEAFDRRMMPDYAGKLLAALKAEQQEGAGESPLLKVPTSPTSDTSQPLTEPLSQRELDVLRLFQTELSGPEIAGELVIALSTLRTHTKGIYSKLNVNSRRAAVKRAADLGLI
jgi:LuxR family maltose regulon positive regulatory protein